MERQEIKKAFDEQYKDIVVTESLKEETLNRIEKMSHKKVIPAWLKSCAAVVLVGCLCMLANTNNVKIADTAETESVMGVQEEAAIGGNINDMGVTLKSTNTLRSSELKKEYGTQEAKTENFNMMADTETTKSAAPLMSAYQAVDMLQADSMEDSVEEVNILSIGDKEEVIEKIYPNAVKSNDIYVAYDGENIIKIKVEEGIIVEIY